MTRGIAFYLPQFHPVAENDEWWGKGFTEWTNVTKSESHFPGHSQPRLPTDLGFCDLRVPETRQAQADMAREYGLHGFCYYHYWFEGKRLLNRPFEEVLAAGEPDFPFCLCWANESWSRRWLGEATNILQEQAYSERDDAEHARWLTQAFADPRYIRVNGRPLFLIYRPTDIPNPRRTTEIMRDVCQQAGLPDPYLVGVDSHCQNTDCRKLGFDNTLQFTPQLGNLPDFMNDEESESKRERNLRFGVDSAKLKLYDYSESIASMLGNKDAYEHSVIPSVFVGWDNTPRRGENAIILLNRGPERFEHYLRQVVEEDNPAGEGLVFVNAWNEWAEGNYLEPDEEYGRAYLEAMARVLKP